MPLLTCSSLLLFYSLLSLLFLNVCHYLFFSFRDGQFWALTLGYVNVFWLGSPNFCIFFLTGSSNIGVLCRSFQLQTSSLCALPFSPALSLCYSSEHCCVTCMTSVILLTFSSSTLTVCNLALCLMSRAFHAFSLLTLRMVARLLNVFTQMCFISGAMLDEQNVITCCMYSSDYDFLFPCYLSPSLPLCLCYSTLLYEKLLWVLFPPRLPLFYL